EGPPSLRPARGSPPGESREAPEASPPRRRQPPAAIRVWVSLSPTQAYSRRLGGQESGPGLAAQPQCTPAERGPGSGDSPTQRRPRGPLLAGSRHASSARPASNLASARVAAPTTPHLRRRGSGLTGSEPAGVMVRVTMSSRSAASWFVLCFLAVLAGCASSRSEGG